MASGVPVGKSTHRSRNDQPAGAKFRNRCRGEDWKKMATKERKGFSSLYQLQKIRAIPLGGGEILKAVQMEWGS